MSGSGTLLVLVLALSGAGKLRAPAAAQRTIQALRLGRLISRPRLAVTSLAVIELVCAGGMIAGTGAAYLVAVSTAWVMTVGFLVVAVRAARLGSSDECGCFGEIVSTPVGAAMTLRNIVLVVAASSAVGTALVCFAAGRSSSLLGGGVESAGAAVVAILAVVSGGILFAGDRRPTVSSTEEHDAHRRVPALIAASDGEVIDPIQRALRGRAQLLVFVRPGCSSCDDVTDAVRSSDLGSVEARVIVTVGDGGEALRDRHGRAALEHTDPSGMLAQFIGLPDIRPAAALITTAGEVLMPFAERREQVLDLISVVAAAQTPR